MKPLPPVLYLAVAGGMVVLDRVAPLVVWGPGPWRAPLGAGLVVAGLALMVYGIVTFRRRRTPLVPGEGRATSLVTGGPFRFSRNPMYLGLSAALVGEAVLLGSLTPWVGVPVFVLVVTRLWIVPEEHWLSASFGDEYARYRALVRRWF